MADFSLFLPRLLRFEGGYVDDPLDPGGVANKGITMRTFSLHARALLGIDPTPAALRALSHRQAGVFHRALHWNAVRGDEIGPQALAEIVCDFQVDAGSRASRLLQISIDALLPGAVAVDGQIGDSTLTALACCDEARVYARYRQGRLDYYRSLTTVHPQLRRFLAGWTARVAAFPTTLPMEQALAS